MRVDTATFDGLLATVAAYSLHSPLSKYFSNSDLKLANRPLVKTLAKFALSDGVSILLTFIPPIDVKSVFKTFSPITPGAS